MRVGRGIAAAAAAAGIGVLARLATLAAADTTAPACGSPPPPAATARTPAAPSTEPTKPTELALRNVRFRFDDCVAVEVRSLHGRLRTSRSDAVVVIDEPASLAIEVADGEVALSGRDLERLLNDHVFAYRGAPLQNLRVTLGPERLVIAGRVQLQRRVSFELSALPERNADGRLRIRHRTISIGGVRIPQEVRRAVGFTLQKRLDLRGATGVAAEGDDLLLDVARIFPPPAIMARVAAVSLAGPPADRRLVVRLAPVAGASTGPGTAAVAQHGRGERPHYVAFVGGRVRFGRLLMEPADLTIVTTGDAPLFDFSLPHYARQLAAGTSQTRIDGSLLVHMPQFTSLPTGR